MSNKILWYHGTDKKSYENIKLNGFNAGTYFAKDLDAAICMGGPYVFTVVSDEHDCWEWITPVDIASDKIHSIRYYTTKLLHYSPDQQRNLIYPNNDYCTNCSGKGEMEYKEDGHHLLPSGSSFKQNRNIVVCEVCNGHGKIIKDY